MKMLGCRHRNFSIWSIFTKTAVFQANMDQIEIFMCLKPSIFICPTYQIIYSAKVEIQIWIIEEGTLLHFMLKRWFWGGGCCGGQLAHEILVTYFGPYSPFPFEICGWKFGLGLGLGLVNKEFKLKLTN